MSSKQLNQVLLGVCGLFVIALGAAVYFGLGYLEDSSAELEEAKVRREVVDMQELSLITAKADLNEYTELEELAKRIIPQEKDQARTVRELTQIANREGISISSISFPASQLGAEGSSRSQSSSQESTEGIITQAVPVTGLSGLYELNVSVQISQQTSYERFIAFLERLERNRRTSQVKSVTITPDPDNRNNVSFSINLAVFLKP